MTITLNGWSRHNIWEHSATVLELYKQRACDEAPEMTCARQAVDLLKPLFTPGDSLLDVGCGAGHFFHSLRRRNIAVEYYGIDATTAFIEIGRRHLAAFGLDPSRLIAGRIEDIDGAIDHVLCMNVLSNIDNFHRPLERMLEVARKSVVLRESITDRASYSYVVDQFIDQPLRVHVNAYARNDICRLAGQLGFEVEEFEDWHAGRGPEMVIGYPHYWTFIRMTRQGKLS